MFLLNLVLMLKFILKAFFPVYNEKEYLWKHKVISIKLKNYRLIIANIDSELKISLIEY